MQTKHLTPFFVERPTPDKPPGTVVETLPVVGGKIPKPPPGATNPVITVYVAQEPPVAIPDAEGGPRGRDDPAERRPGSSP